jgi:parallel beta-helix repeat protein
MDSGITIVNSKNDYFEIRNCKIINSSGDIYSAGIKLGIDVANGTVIENNCSKNEGHGIINYGNNTIINNTIYDNMRDGIYSNYTAVIKGNFITRNNENGLELIGMYNITQNIITSNQFNGIILNSTSSFNNITENQIRNNMENGIYLLSGTNRTKIQDNDISRNSLKGILLEGKSLHNISHTLITGNRISKNNVGIKLNEYTKSNTVWRNVFTNNTNFNAIDNSITNSWDNSSLGGTYKIGNYWNNYTGTDTGSGIGDTPYRVNWTQGINDTAPILYMKLNAVTGTAVKITDPVTDVSLEFEQVDSSGSVKVKMNDSLPIGADDPTTEGVNVTGSYYEITNDTSFFSGNVLVSLPYDEDDLSFYEGFLRMWHWNGSRWEDITTWIDMINNIIYGNSSGFSPFTVIEPPDSDPPETEISFKGTKFPSGWYNEYPELILDSYDGGSGVNITGFSYDSNTWYTKEATSEVNSFKAQFDLNETPYKPTEEEAEITIHYNSTDNKGNRESTLTTTIKVDKVAPSSSMDFTGTKYGDIYTSSVTVELSASDGGSGLDYTEYRINDGQWFVYSKSFTLENDGEYSIDVRSYDLVDNQGEITTETITIDRTAPSISSSIIGTQGNDNWYTSEIQITLTAQDDSGTQIFYRKDTYSAWQLYTTPFNLSKEGTNYLYYYAVDQAGNEAVEQSETFYIDTNDPILDVQLSRTPVNDYYLGGVNISLSAEDSNSGVEDGNIEVKINDGQWLPYTEAIELTEDGTYSLSYKVTDNAGNLGEGQKEIKIDSTAPSVDVQINGTVGSNGWYTSYVNVTLTANDDGSGYKSIKYSFNDADYTTYYTPFPIKNEGTTSLYIKLEDKIGNTEKITKSVKIDLSLNDTKIILRGTASTEGWYNDKVNITLNATDDISGVDYVEYSFDKEYWLKYNKSFFYDVEGNNTIYYRYYDMAGNKEATKSKEIYIDKSSPDTEVSLDGQKSDRGWFITNVVVSFTASDTLSGILKTQYKMNSTDWNDYSAPFTVSQEGNNTVEYRSIDVANNAEEIKTVKFEINKQSVPRGPNPILIGGIIGGIGLVAAVAIVFIRKKLNAGE